jgi:hypothetical protein
VDHCTKDVEVTCLDTDCPVSTNKTTTLTATGHNWNGNNCSNAGCTETKTTAMKFLLSVTSKASVTATVYDDYSLEVVLPSSTATVSAASATIDVKMQNVSSLNVTDMRSETINIDTGLNDTQFQNITLSDYLNSCYHFDGATVNIDIDGTTCAYKFDPIDSNNMIIGRPTNIEDTRTAWQNMIEGNIETSTGSGTRITINNTSILLIGNSLLAFEDNAQDLVLSTGTTKKNICDAVELSENVTMDGVSSPIFAGLGAGTSLSVDTSCATLSKDVTIAVDGIDLNQPYNNTYLGTALGTLRTTVDGGNGSTAELVLNLITLFDAVVNAVDVNDNVTVTLNFLDSAT